jgi:hypothetical protein
VYFFFWERVEKEAATYDTNMMGRNNKYVIPLPPGRKAIIKITLRSAAPTVKIIVHQFPDSGLEGMDGALGTANLSSGKGVWMRGGRLNIIMTTPLN